MTRAVQSVRNAASYVPAKVRGVIYTLIGTAVMLEGIWDVVPEPFEGKALKTVTVLGFGLALANTSSD